MLYLQARRVGERDASTTAQAFQPIAIELALEMVPTEPEYGEIMLPRGGGRAARLHVRDARRLPPEPWPAELGRAIRRRSFRISCRPPSTAWSRSAQTGRRELPPLSRRSGGARLSRRSGAGNAGGARRAAVRPRATRAAREVGAGACRTPLPVQAPHRTGPRVSRPDYLARAAARRRRARERARRSRSTRDRCSCRRIRRSRGSRSTADRRRAVVADADALTSRRRGADQRAALGGGRSGASGGPGAILKELTHERRHLFQSAGLFDRCHGS